MPDRTYEDFRPLRPGDKGWYKDKSNRVQATPEKIDARQYFNKKTHEFISLRQYRNLQRGVTETQYVKQRETQGIKKKQYKKRGQPKPKPVPKPKSQIPSSKKQVAKQKQIQKDVYQERAEFLKQKFLDRISLYFGTTVTWEELDNRDKSLFWFMYHDLVDKGMPTEADWRYYYEDFFAMDYDEVEDIEYGETP